MLNNYKHMACSTAEAGRSSSDTITTGSQLSHEDDEAYRLAVLICTPPRTVPASMYFNHICRQLVDILLHPRCRAGLPASKPPQNASLDLIVALNCVNILLKDLTRSSGGLVLFACLT